MQFKLTKRSTITLAVQLLILSGAVLTPLAAYGAPGLTTSHLRCEYLVDPLGVQTTAPRLSWQVESSNRDEHQSAYRILVADSETQLAAGNADLWDSGKAPSNATVGIEYQGRPLTSGELAYWKVEVWDKLGNHSDSGANAHWQMGLLEPSDWKAQWISADCQGRRRHAAAIALSSANVFSFRTN